jgi:hypothetical protein
MSKSIAKRLHGEAIIIEIDKLPEQVEKYIPKSTDWEKGAFIIAQSETSGNHHAITLEPEDSVYTKGNCFIFDIKGDRKVKCTLDEARHSTEILPAGIHVRAVASEFDLLERVRRNVAD